MKKIIIINGGAGTGKSTFVNICSKMINVSEVSSVDLAKKSANILVGYNNEKDEKTRKLLSDLKELADKYNNSNILYIEKKITEFYTNDSLILFIYLREPKDIDYFKNKYDAKTLLIENLNVDKIKSNIGDASVNNYKYDYKITNNNIEEFTMEANNFLKWLSNEKN